MRTFGITVLVFMLVVVMFFGGFLIAGVGALNREASLHAQISAHKRVQEASYDSMKKIISQKTQLPAAARSDLLQLLPTIVEGRQGGSVFKAVSERYPELTLELYKDLSRSIEAERHVFLREQSTLFDIKAQHDALLGSAFGGTVCKVFGRGPVDVTVVSSTDTKETIRTGVEDDTNLKLLPNSVPKSERDF